MSLGKWIANVGGPGSCARWAIKGYRKIRSVYPTKAEMSEPDVLKLIAASRYGVIPNRKAQIFIDQAFQAGGLNTLEGLTITILQAEHGWHNFSFPETFIDVVREQMKSARIYPYDSLRS